MADSFVQWMPIPIKQLMNGYPFKLTASTSTSTSTLFHKTIGYNRLARKIAIANLGGPVKRKINWKEKKGKETANCKEHFHMRGHTCLCFCFLGVNECSNYNGYCQQICNDTKTSYFCSCLPGYEVDKKDPKGCQGNRTLIVVYCQAA